MARRPSGTGSISFNKRQGYWQAKVHLAGGRRRIRSVFTREDAEEALARLLIEFEDELGYHYSRRKRFRCGEGPRPLRAAISPRVRFAVFDRDGFACRYCGASRQDDARLTLDHVVPVIDGGADDMDNLVTACAECNAGKGGRPLLAPVPAIPERVSPP